MFNAKKIMVAIRRSITDIVTKAIFEHEVEILQEIYGESAITITKPTDRDKASHILERPVYKGEKPKIGQPPNSYAPTWPLDEKAEHDRLAVVYGRRKHVDETYVEYIFGPARKSRLAKEYNVDDAPDKPTKKQKLQAQLEALSMEHEGLTVAEMEDLLKPDPED